MDNTLIIWHYLESKAQAPCNCSPELASRGCDSTTHSTLGPGLGRKFVHMYNMIFCVFLSCLHLEEVNRLFSF